MCFVSTFTIVVMLYVMCVSSWRLSFWRTTSSKWQDHQWRAPRVLSQWNLVLVLQHTAQCGHCGLQAIRIQALHMWANGYCHNYWFGEVNHCHRGQDIYWWQVWRREQVQPLPVLQLRQRWWREGSLQVHKVLWVWFGVPRPPHWNTLL